jgi:hypothetical protein
MRNITQSRTDMGISSKNSGAPRVAWRPWMMYYRRNERLTPGGVFVWPRVRHRKPGSGG